MTQVKWTTISIYSNFHKSKKLIMTTRQCSLWRLDHIFLFYDITTDTVVFLKVKFSITPLLMLCACRSMMKKWWIKGSPLIRYPNDTSFKASKCHICFLKFAKSPCHSESFFIKLHWLINHLIKYPLCASKHARHCKESLEATTTKISQRH